MSVIIVNGVPGKGKTLNLTREAISQFNKENTFIKRFFRKRRGEEEFKNLIYSSYPILLNKKHRIFSHKVSVYDLTIDNAFP